MDNNFETANEALEKAGLNWIAEEHELVTGGFKTVPNHKAIVRSDKQEVIGVVGRRYQPIQNTDAFSFFDTICQEHGARYTRAEAIKGGSKILLQAQFGDDFEIRPGDSCKARINLLNSHDGSGSFYAYYTAFRLVCSNGLHAWRKDAQHQVRLRHSSGIQLKIQDAFRVFGLGVSFFADFKERSQYLANKILDKAKVERFLDEVIGSAKREGRGDSTRILNRRIKVENLFENGKGNGGGTAWDLYNGLTEFVDHFSQGDERKRFESSVCGSGANLKAKAFDAALAL